jgi:DNA-binding MurR/RpiR family transcriptional regulator
MMLFHNTGGVCEMKARAIAKTPSPAEAGGLLLQIQTLYPQLTAKEQAIADYIFKNKEVVYQSITEFVSRSKVGYGSVVRFCKRLGCAGFQEFKIKLAQDLALHKAGSDFRTDAEKWTPAMAEEACRDIRNTARILSEKELERAAKAVLSARHILSVGAGAALIIAKELEYRFCRYGLPAVAMAESHLQNMRAATLTSDDAIVLVSFSGSTKDVLRSGELARKAGATLICLTNFAESPISAISDIRLVTAVRVDPLSEEMVSNIAMDFVVDLLSKKIAELAKDSNRMLMKTFQATAERTL